MEELQLIKDIKNKTWKFFVLSVLLMSAVGCQTKKSDNGSDTLFENVCLIPDSLRTFEQQWILQNGRVPILNPSGIESPAWMREGSPGSSDLGLLFGPLLGWGTAS